MKWYQKLFFKVFIVTWLVSVLLMGGLVFGLLRANETHHWQALMETRAAGYAQLVLERQEANGDVRHRHDSDRNRGRFSLRMTDLETGQVIQDFRRPMAASEVVAFQLVADNNRTYLIEIPRPEQPLHLDRMLRFILSVQMVLIIIMAMLVALFVSLWVVKPINRLKLFARSLHDEQNLSSRTDSQLNARNDEIGELAREFDAMAGYVEKTLQARQQLLRDVSHELRAPLARMQVATAILEQQSTQIENPLLGQINRESEQLAKLIDQLLSLSRLDDQTLTMTSSIEVKSFIESIGQQWLLLYPEHHLDIVVNPESLNVTLNTGLLERILSNALENAFKYSPKGSSVSVSVSQQVNALSLIISDQGPGIDAQHLEQIFEPFYRLDDAIQGYGLGLSILKSAVRRLHGEVVAKNTAEGGLTIMITLPNSN